MNCDQAENLTLESLDGSLPATDQARLDQHLAACPHCRSFRATQTRLDAQLTQALPLPALGADFASRLNRRIEALEAGRAAARDRSLRAAEAEYAAWLETVRPWRLWLWRDLWLDSLGYATVAGLLGWILARSLQPLTQLTDAILRNSPAEGIALAAAAVALLFIAGGLWLGSRPRVTT